MLIFVIETNEIITNTQTAQSKSVRVLVVLTIHI